MVSVSIEIIYLKVYMREIATASNSGFNGRKGSMPALRNRSCQVSAINQHTFKRGLHSPHFFKVRGEYMPYSSCFISG